MEHRKSLKLSMIALAISVLPLATFIPNVLHLSISDEIRTIWAGVNILSIMIALVLSIICVKSKESRGVVNIISTVISSFWVLLMLGILAFALLINFVQ